MECLEKVFHAIIAKLDAKECTTKCPNFGMGPSVINEECQKCCGLWCEDG